MNRRRYLTVMGATLLSGCAGEGGGDEDSADTTPTPTSTESPTPTPTPTPTLDDVEFPDGVTESEVTTDLVTTHQELVLGEPYTIEKERVTDNRIKKTTIEIGTNEVHQQQVSSSTSSKSFYKEGTTGFARANGGEYYFETSSPIEREQLAKFYDIHDHIEAGEYVPTGVEQGDNGLLIQAEATDATVEKRMEQRSIEAIESYSGSLQIAPNGQIVQWTHDWEFTRGGRATSEEFTYRTMKIGSTTVSKPEWLDTAREEAFTFTLRGPSDDGSDYVAVDIEGDGRLPSNIYARLSNQGRSVGNPVDISIGGGDTLYIAFAQEGLRIAKEPEFSDATTLDGRVRVFLDINGVSVIENSTVSV